VSVGALSSFVQEIVVIASAINIVIFFILLRF
jgi:hypothetical protein